MKIRPFQPDDAESCFRLRSNAFIQKFYGELTLEEIAAAVNAHMPKDYILMAQENPCFIVEEDGNPIGFFNLKRKNNITAQIPLIYFDLDRLGAGLGTACIEYMEKWLLENWLEVNTLIVDTVIPKYNSGFYQKVGFNPVESTYCEFLGKKLNALRLAKKIR